MKNYRIFTATAVIAAGLVLLPAPFDAFAATEKKPAAAKPVKKPAQKKAAAKPAKKPVASNLDGNWQKTFALLNDTSDPVAQKLVVWLHATENKTPSEPRALMRFIEQNPDWPRLHAVRRKIERSIADSDLPAADVAVWFDTQPPLGYDGIRAYLDALTRLGQTTRARAALADFWKGAELSRNETASLVASYKSLFAKGAMAARMDHLIWEGRASEADTMLAFVDANTRALGYARLSLGKMAPDAASAVARVPQALQGDEGLLFERMKYRRRKDTGNSALEMLYAFKGHQARPDKWWPEIHIMARRAIEKGEYKTAYTIASRHQLESGAEFAGAEWLLGWLKLNHLHDAVAAYRHFDKLYRGVGSAVSRSRAAYWAAKASEKLKEMPTAAQWHKIAAFYPSTFYGQLSYIALNGAPNAAALSAPPPSAEAVAAFGKNELARAVRLLHKAKLSRTADPFFTKLLALAKTREDFQLVARLAKESGRLYYAIDANKQMQQTIGGYMLEEGYPVLPSKTPAKPERALIHAIIHRESMFDPNAESTAGARGLMQLMPGTAKMMAKKTGRGYKLESLTADPAYNIALGSKYLEGLVEQYGGYYPMAIAAYNAGPGRVSQWIALFGDPRGGTIDQLDWIEHIPIYETRNYVQRVMESYFMYKVKMGETPRTILDFVSKPAR